MTVCTDNNVVKHLPGLGDVGGVQFAGYVSVTGEANPSTATGEDESLFYWFVGTDDWASRPTVVWSNGGPGSSSFWGFFTENGPYIVEDADTPKLSVRESAWNKEVNYLMIEHPLSVTLSFAKDSTNIPVDVVAGTVQYYQALLNIIAKHPEIKDNPIVLAGESYAGTYLPLLAKAIRDGGVLRQQLKATVLVDAWVNPYVQMAQNTNYAFMHGLISRAQKDALDAKYEHNYPAVNAAISALCPELYMANTALAGDPPFDPVMKYLNRPDVRAAINVSNDTVFTANYSQQISDNYAAGVNDSYAGTVQELMEGEDGLRMIIVSGLNDAKDCNFLGTGAWLELLEGTSAEQFEIADTVPWVDKNAPVPYLGSVQDGATTAGGIDKDGGKLAWVKVMNAGHLAVGDQPLLLGKLRELGEF